MEKLTIELFGRKGDGVARHHGKEIYVPGTLAGESITVRGSGPRRELVSIEVASPNRITPKCKHFTECGGCQTQHMAEQAYLEWKKRLVEEPLQKAGITTPIDPIVTFGNEGRRRAVFQARHTAHGCAFGFSAAKSNQIISIEECVVLDRQISDQLPVLKSLAELVTGGKTTSRMSVLATKNGLDIALENTGKTIDSNRQKLISLAIENQICRLSTEDETLIETRKPEIDIAGISVLPPPGCFVQAVKSAETCMSDLVASHLNECKQVADLYCGIGTFALRLAEHSTVLAIENNKPAVEALNQAWRSTGGRLKQINTEVRNLEHRPVGFPELKKTEGVVFDPPRSGAELQARQIAKSSVSKVAAVSCNPVTLTRDLEILVSAGFTVSRIIPLDQFKHTSHLEVVALLER